MRKLLASLLIMASPIVWAASACDSDAPLPTTGRELRSERVELQRRLALVEQRLAALEGAASSRSPATTAPTANFVAPRTTAPAQRELPPGCYVGPRGGTYTITKSGRKNYGGC
ncbi:MAG: hypothetical protein KJ011_05195 [Burkholderiaceae bacterium]|nr:hypothetical protein [Burkholderiaceae bacterium]